MSMRVVVISVANGEPLIALELPHVPRTNERVTIDDASYHVLRVEWVLATHAEECRPNDATVNVFVVPP